MEVGSEVNAKHDRQCTYNVTLGRVRAIIVAVQKQSVLHIACMSAALVIQHAMHRILL
jgi:hypothetical protein